jgi:hypothetical protein
MIHFLPNVGMIIIVFATLKHTHFANGTSYSEENWLDKITNINIHLANYLLGLSTNNLIEYTFIYISCASLFEFSYYCVFLVYDVHPLEYFLDKYSMSFQVQHYPLKNVQSIY